MAGNVTVIVGNGLDVSLGLKTSYSAFYAYVKDNNLHPENSIYKAIAKEEPEWWVDFELGLGRFTDSLEKVNEKERDAWSERLSEELDEIKKDLKRYLREQNNLKDELLKSIKFSIRSLYDGVEEGQVANTLVHFSLNPPTSIRFVTLNYTSVLEKLFPHRGNSIIGQDYRVLSPIHHVHGSLEGKISLGVNDETQISSYISLAEKNYIIKPRIIELMNDHRIEKLGSYISSANLIVLFGLSIGATDKYIWELIADWLRNSDKLLIIHHYEKDIDVDDLTEREYLRLVDRVKNKFLDYSDLEDSTRSVLRNKIYVILNTKTLFKVVDKPNIPQVSSQ